MEFVIEKYNCCYNLIYFYFKFPKNVDSYMWTIDLIIFICLVRLGNWAFLSDLTLDFIGFCGKILLLEYSMFVEELVQVSVLHISEIKYFYL